MNTKIGTSFGLAALLAIAAIATMFALGAFTAKPASAAIGTVALVSSPTTAGAAAQHTVTVSGGATDQNAIAVGGTITVTFDSKFTVPSSIAASAVKLKSSKVSDGSGVGTANQLVSAGAITISGRAVTITVPDMDPQTATASLGDNGIATSAKVTITFTQAAGITNPKLAVAANTRSVTVKSSADTTAVTSATSTAVTSSVSYTPTTAARGATITVTGKGFAANCDDCKIRMHPVETQGTAPSTGNEGSGTIDANGVFTGTIVTDASSNRTDNYIWVVDATGTGMASSTKWVQKAGATPTATSVTPGSTVTSTLVDFTADEVLEAGAPGSIVTVGTNTSITNLVNTLDSSGNTAALTPFKFTMPISTVTGSHKVTINDGQGKTATFNIDVIARTLTVTPNPAAIGQTITISGTGFTKNGTISTITGSGSANLDASGTADIDVDSAGAFSHTTTMDTINSSAGRTSDAYTVTATDSGSLVGTSSGFKRTARTLTLSETTAAPGVSFEVSVTGMTVNDSENTTTATFTMTISTGTLTGTTAFPVGSDGSGTGTISIPLDATQATLTLTATDNADDLNADGDADRTAQATIKVAAGTVVVNPASASTGKIVTVTGSNYPPNTTGTILTFGGASAIPTGGFSSDSSGNIEFTTEVPAKTTGGSLAPGNKIVIAKVGSIQGTTTAFDVANPSITITPAEAAPEETIVITGTGFNALSAVTTLDIGTASALPSPAPKAGRSGDLTATVEVPLLNAGTYTVVVTNKTGFTATGTFKAVAAKSAPAATADNTETVFADVIANSDNLVRVWRFSNADQSWSFFDPRPAFSSANTLVKTGAGDIVWVSVSAEQSFQGGTLFEGWSLIVLD
jgi:hypothetical protein